ncbi:hypothetical protein J5500_01285 [Candidatus Saccharibacteria bacterium]|nr:hypothetical protein [Candidatus Saccharibacteria bacterium]
MPLDRHPQALSRVDTLKQCRIDYELACPDSLVRLDGLHGVTEDFQHEFVTISHFDQQESVTVLAYSSPDFQDLILVSKGTVLSEDVDLLTRISVNNAR